MHLVELLGVAREVWVYDNSREADVASGERADPLLVLHLIDGVIVDACEIKAVPEWAKPIMMEAIRLSSLP